MAESKQSNFRVLVRALRHRNFRLFFVGQSISLVGTWMQRIALGWLVYRLTDSAFLLGLVSFSGQIPVLLLGPFAGVLADRINRQKLLIFTQTISMLQAAILATLVFADLIQIWQLVVLSLILGITNAVDMPTRQSFMVQMIDDRDDLGNAIALNSSMVNGARLIGPSAAGLLIVVAGEGLCFLINAITYLAVILSLLLMRVARPKRKPRSTRVWQELREGLSYAAGFEPIRAILLILALASFVGMPYAVLMPIFARDILHGGPDALGFMMGASGIGALIGAYYLASRRSIVGLGKMVPISVTIVGAGLILFSFSQMLLLSMLLLLIIGIGQMIEMALSNTILQTIVDEDKRGRVMSLYTVSIMGMMPLGSLVAGSAASHFGAPWTVRVAGIICIIAAAIFAGRLPTLRRLMRPIFVSKGIIPEIARGLHSATEAPLPEKEGNQRSHRENRE